MRRLNPGHPSVDLLAHAEDGLNRIAPEPAAGDARAHGAQRREHHVVLVLAEARLAEQHDDRVEAPHARALECARARRALTS